VTKSPEIFLSTLPMKPYYCEPIVYEVRHFRCMLHPLPSAVNLCYRPANIVTSSGNTTLHIALIQLANSWYLLCGVNFPVSSAKKQVECQPRSGDPLHNRGRNKISKWAVQGCLLNGGYPSNRRAQNGGYPSNRRAQNDNVLYLLLFSHQGLRRHPR